MGKRVASARALASFTLSLTEEEALVLVDEPEKVRLFLAERARWIAEHTFVTPISDEEAVQLLIQWKGHTKESAEAKVRAWRAYAQKSGYNSQVVFLVKAGFTMELASDVGKCSRSLQELIGKFDCRFNTPTEDSLVFWVPRMAWGTVDKPNADDKLMSWGGYTKLAELRGKLRKVHGLPEGHCNCFGSAALLTALILAHLKRTGDRVPKNDGCVISDTTAIEKWPREHWDTITPRTSGQVTIGAHYKDSGLCFSVMSGGCIGFYLIGVEKLAPVTPTGK